MADLVEWPPGLRPLSGRVQVGHLTNIGEFHLRRELLKRNWRSTGSMTRMAKRLHQLLVKEALELGLDEKTQQRKRYVLPAPPSPPARVKRLHGLHPKERLPTMQQNQSGLYINMLGSGSGIATEYRHKHSVILNVNQELWLFDVSEDTQRQIINLPDVRGGRMTRIFLTGKSEEELWGLPGILCTISESREEANPQMNNPINIYGPPGIVQFIFNMMEVSDTYISMPVIVHELHSTKVEDIFHRKIAQRSRLYAIDVPADQYNVDGWFNGELTSWSLPPMSKRQKAEAILFTKQANRLDLRMGYRPQEMPPPGKPQRSQLPPWELSWTIRCSSGYTVVAVPMRHPSPSYAYIIQESARAGKLFPDRAHSLQVRPGQNFSKLKQGQSVINEKGQTVTPDMVMGYDRPGRKIVICGHTSDMRAAMGKAKKADIVLVKSPFTSDAAEEAEKQQKLTVQMAAQVAQELQIGTLIISSISDRHTDMTAFSQEDREIYLQKIKDEVASNFKGSFIVPDDEDILIIERRNVNDIPFWARKGGREQPHYGTYELDDEEDDEDEDEDEFDDEDDDDEFGEIDDEEIDLI